MIDPNRLKDVSAFLDTATNDLAPKLAAFHKALVTAGLEPPEALAITQTIVASILAVPSPVESK